MGLHLPTVSVQEGDNSVINCTYSDSASDYFLWYKQESGKGPQSIIDIRSNMAKRQGQRLTVLLNKTMKHLSLQIAATEPGDSAVYFCAENTHCFPGTCNHHPNLRWEVKQHLLSFRINFNYNTYHFVCS